MDFERKNNTYKIIMLIIITTLITFIVTSIGMYNYYNNKKTANVTQIQKNTLDARIELVRAYLNERYIGKIDSEEKLIEMAVKGYVAGIDDEYTEYLTKSEYEDLMVDVNGDYVGIGVYMTQDRYENILVLLPIEGSPAEAAGLKTGDIITKINGEECVGQELEVVSNKIKGPEGTTVELEISRENETFIKTIERKSIQINQMKSEKLENNIGYIKLMAFDTDSNLEFEKKVDELVSQGVKSLIIDLRNNGGGIVEEVEEIAELFLPKDKIIMIEKNKIQDKIETKAKKDAKYNLNVVIISNENSASASEILIGALKENGIAKIVGTKTFGKGVMQEVIPIITGGALKVTIEEFFTPDGNVINKKGIEPDIVVEENAETAVDEQLQKAIEICK